jgi:hypothetical protein
MCLWNLSNLIHQRTREMCLEHVQSNTPTDQGNVSVEPVQSNTPTDQGNVSVEPVQYNTSSDQGNVSDCTRCWNTQILF